MCDDKGGAGTSEGHAGRMGATMFDSCGPMMKHMFKAVHEATEGAAKSSPAEAAGATDPGDSTTEQGATAGGAKGDAMNPLEPRDRELVALGAAMGSNCVPCIEYHVPEARKAGLADAQIREAIRLADQVRKVPARKVLDAALRLLPEIAAPASAGAADSPCAQPAPAPAGETPCCA